MGAELFRLKDRDNKDYCLGPVGRSRLILYIVIVFLFTCMCASIRHMRKLSQTSLGKN